MVFELSDLKNHTEMKLKQESFLMGSDVRARFFLYLYKKSGTTTAQIAEFFQKTQHQTFCYLNEMQKMHLIYHTKPQGNNTAHKKSNVWFLNTKSEVECLKNVCLNVLEIKEEG